MCEMIDLTPLAPLTRGTCIPQWPAIGPIWLGNLHAAIAFERHRAAWSGNPLDGHPVDRAFDHARASHPFARASARSFVYRLWRSSLAPAARHVALPRGLVALLLLASAADFEPRTEIV